MWYKHFIKQNNSVSDLDLKVSEDMGGMGMVQHKILTNI